jgi:phosphopantothenoylcysteine synthetase/decarboxylase
VSNSQNTATTADGGASAPAVLYVLVCAAPRARNVGQLVTLAQAAGWRVCVVATPQALQFFDVGKIEELTGYPARSSYKHPDEPDVLPPATAMIACPVTFNTLNKWALGLADTLVLGLLTEAVGLGLPLVAGPSLNNAQERHPAFRRSVAALREMGVHVLYGPGVYEPAAPGTGGRDYDWGMLLRELDNMLTGRQASGESAGTGNR